VKAVRIAAARALAAVTSASLTSQQQAALDRAGDELIAAEEANAERPEAQLSIGSFQAQRGHYVEAEAAYHEALRLDPKSTPVMVNLADLYREMNRDSDAKQMLHQAIATDPGYAPAYHALGLLLVRAHDMPNALSALQKAVALAPQDARYAYVYAIALNSAEQTGNALTVLKWANGQHPADADILTALATISRDTGDREAALAYAEKLVAVAPNDQQAKALLESLGNP
jgi:predicted Zn-dependent protease